MPVARHQAKVQGRNFMAKYRIIKIDDICPWQVQKRTWLFWWVDVCLSFSSIYSAGNHLNELIDKDKFLSK